MYNPAKRGSTVHEHTASIVPEIDATEYEIHFLALHPKYFNTAFCEINIAMAPAMKKAGIKQNSTCSLAYSPSILKDSKIAPSI